VYLVYKKERNPYLRRKEKDFPVWEREFSGRKTLLAGKKKEKGGAPSSSGNVEMLKKKKPYFLKGRERVPILTQLLQREKTESKVLKKKNFRRG